MKVSSLPGRMMNALFPPEIQGHDVRVHNFLFPACLNFYDAIMKLVSEYNVAGRKVKYYFRKEKRKENYYSINIAGKYVFWS